MIWRRDEDRAEDRGAKRDQEREEKGAQARIAEEEAGTRPARREERAMGDQGGEVTIVGAGAKLEGTVVSAGSLRVDGQVKGQINADGDVALSPQSQVEADIRAQNVSVAGRFKGNIIVKGKAHLARGGRIDGNITSKTLVVEEGGIFHGQSIMDGGAPSTAQVQQPAQAQQPARAASSASQAEKTPGTVKVP
jgi:cytoskeletal protein CcmA (bactofilin family)